MLITENMKIYLYTPPTDMRKSIDTLCIMVSETLKMNPIDGQRGGYHAERFLSGFVGYLQTDAFSGLTKCNYKVFYYHHTPFTYSKHFKENF